MARDIDLRVTVTGLNRIERKLETLPRVMRGRVLARALRQTMNPVRNALRSILPRRRGNLKSAVRIRIFRFTRFLGMKARLGFSRRGAHAQLLEYGTVNKDGSQRIVPRRYVKKTVRQQQDRIADNFSEKILQEIAKALR